MSKARAGLITSVMIGLLAITTAGVSTYAWFQANASATVTASPTSTQITVSKPDDYMFMYYNKNGLSNYGSPNGTFGNDFSAVLDNSLTNLTNMYPGQAMTFLVKFESVTSKTVTITKLKANTAIMQRTEGAEYTNLLARYQYVDDTHKSYAINIAWAIDIYATYYLVNHGSTLTGYSTFITKPTDSTASGGLELDDLMDCDKDDETALAYSRISSNIRTLSTPIVLTDYDDGDGTKDLYVFYTVKFVNTLKFKEVTGTGGDVLYPPEDTAANISSETYRYFQLPVGNEVSPETLKFTSSCFANLSFAINEITIS